MLQAGPFWSGFFYAQRIFRSGVLVMDWPNAPLRNVRWLHRLHDGFGRRGVVVVACRRIIECKSTTGEST